MLPYASRRAPTAEKPVVSQRRSLTSAVPEPPIRLVWIDDDPDHLKAIAKSLIRDGCRIEFAATGSAGIEAVLQGAADVVILDWKLPDMTGGEVLKRIRSAGCRTPVLMLTGYGNEGVAFQCGRHGANVYLTKPARAADLLVVIREWTGRQSATALDSPESIPQDFDSPTSDRLAEAIVLAVHLKRDPRRFSDWQQVPGVTADSLHRMCELLELDGRDVLVFVRLLRAVFLVQARGARFAEVLDVADPRTLAKLVGKGRFSLDAARAAVTVAVFLDRQMLLKHETVPAGIRDRLLRAGLMH